MRSFCAADERADYWQKLPNGEIIYGRAKTDSIGAQNHLYSFRRPGQMHDPVLETDFFSEIDGVGAKLIKIFLEERRPLTPDEAFEWAIYMTALIVRHPKNVAELTDNETLRELMNKDPEEYLAARLEGDPETLYDWVEQRLPNAVPNHMLATIPQIAFDNRAYQAFLKMKYGVLDFSRCGEELLTTDWPILVDVPPGENAGIENLNNPNVAVTMPLSPTKAFVAMYRPLGDLLQNKRQLARVLNKMQLCRATIQPTLVIAQSKTNEPLIQKHFGTPTKDLSKS